MSAVQSDGLTPRADTAPPRRFSIANADGWKRHLSEEGYCVIASVANADECANAERLFWAWVEAVEPRVNPEDAATWRHIPCSRFTGIVSSGGIGQSEFAWRLRSLPAVVRAFAQIWGCDDRSLISSFDGANCFRPFRAPAGAADLATSGGWWHIDQSAAKQGLHAVQGLVSVTASTAATGGLCVLPGTHREHAEVSGRYAHVKQDYVHLARDDPLLARVRDGHGPGALLVTCGAGDLLLWDSRVVHCNTPALRQAPEQGTPRLLRLAAYVCMTERSRADAVTLRARRRAVDELGTSTHWPDKSFHVTNSWRSLRPLGGPSRFEMLTPAQAALV
ncbi:hypothetical protein KFE25_012433 [Diacronema lutheri]|uniref:Phytanoyl-CoA dioxygenase n=1 Tax=Diacronema lutheri TaxID=2081491 RepID=A0A8J5XTC6_DIALT|nr:hypothetical protein KFE25_012433 [Diacronema lutheri]